MNDRSCDLAENSLCHWLSLTRGVDKFNTQKPILVLRNILIRELMSQNVPKQKSIQVVAVLFQEWANELSFNAYSESETIDILERIVYAHFKEALK